MLFLIPTTVHRRQIIISSRGNKCCIIMFGEVLQTLEKTSAFIFWELELHLLLIRVYHGTAI